MRPGCWRWWGVRRYTLWGRGGGRHSLYRHLDHAAIFVMIAGTYTPFTAILIGGGRGLRLLAVIWAMALRACCSS
jgi:channel protein (hemolysin III family)